VELVDKLAGSESAKERLKLILRTLNGEEGVDEACQQLGVGQTRLGDLKIEALQAALEALEPKPKGRPANPEPSPETKELAALRKERSELLLDLRAAQIREEIALIAPHLLKRPGMKFPDEKKKPTRSERLQRRNEIHGERLCAIQRDLELKPKDKYARGFETQQLRREWERKMKIDCLCFARLTQQQGVSSAQSAERLMLNPPTLAGWKKGWQKDKLALKPRGRKLRMTDQITRECLLAVYYLAGPGIGFPTLRSLFPGAPVRDLEHLLRRLRAMNLHAKGYYVHALRWHQPGTVWALDHVVPPQPVDGIYPYVLAVRDLASGYQLMALPVKTKGAKEVVEALESLFLEHGAPLVLKSDLGFKAAEISELLEIEGVLQLLSPARYPRYNGSIEAGIGSVQTRAHHEAARHGHAGEWNCNDVEAARLQANELARPWGFDQSSPKEAWAARPRLKECDRWRLWDEMERALPSVRQELGLLPGIEGSNREEEAVNRAALTRALVECKFLTIRRSRITPPVNG
jgi:transposase-like protein